MTSAVNCKCMWTIGFSVSIKWTQQPIIIRRQVLKALAVIMIPVVRSRLDKKGRKCSCCQHCQQKRFILALLVLDPVINFKWCQSLKYQIHGWTSRFCVENCVRLFWYKRPLCLKKKWTKIEVWYTGIIVCWVAFWYQLQ